jgi:hypothetical protein
MVDSASNRNEYQEYFLGGKRGRCVGLTTLPPSCADCLQNLGASTSWNPKGLSRPVMGLLYLFLTFTFTLIIIRTCTELSDRLPQAGVLFSWFCNAFFSQNAVKRTMPRSCLSVPSASW